MKTIFGSKKISDVHFSDIESGETFIWEGSLFVKLSSPIDFKNDIGMPESYNCFGFNDDELYRFEGADIVQRVNAYVVIDLD